MCAREGGQENASLFGSRVGMKAIPYFSNSAINVSNWYSVSWRKAQCKATQRIKSWLNMSTSTVLLQGRYFLDLAITDLALNLIKVSEYGKQIF